MEQWKIAVSETQRSTEKQQPVRSVTLIRVSGMSYTDSKCGSAFLHDAIWVENDKCYLHMRPDPDGEELTQISFVRDLCENASIHTLKILGVSNLSVKQLVLLGNDLLVAMAKDDKSQVAQHDLHLSNVSMGLLLANTCEGISSDFFENRATCFLRHRPICADLQPHSNRDSYIQQINNCTLM